MLKLLETLSQFPNGVPQTYLAKALNVSKPYISILLKNLEKQGIVYRIRIGNMYIVKKAIEHKTPDNHNTISKILKIGIVWSSEYLFLGHFAKLLKDEDIELKIYVYPSALQTIFALIRGEVDGILSPLVTQVYGYMLSKSFAIVGGGASGGGYIYELPYSSTDIVISSEISTMDLCRYLAIKRRYIDSSSTRYFSSNDEALAIARRGLARYAVIWHPINLEVEALGGKRVINCIDIEETKYCCTLALSRSLGFDKINKILGIYKKAINIYARNRERFLEWYSAIVGISLSILKKAINEYTYNHELDIKHFNKVLDALSIEVPSKTHLYTVTQI